ncbi:MAG: Cna B-type domain-containing protein, partial [Carnobacterium sp.]|nr:Cna B-type domain-containing protein [Carnobacterium sp.]
MKINKMIKGLFVFLTLFLLMGIKKTNFISAQNIKDVTDGTKIKITNLKITSTNDNEPRETIALRTSYEFKFDWDATAYEADLREGDYFTIQLPNAMVVAEEQANKELDIRDSSNNLVAKAVITPSPGGKGGGHIKFTFTNFVNTHGNIKGNFNMKFLLDKDNVTVNQKNNLGVTVGTTFTSIKNDGIYIKSAGTQDPNEILGKWSVGRVMKELYRGGENLVIKDPAVLDIIKKGATRWLLRINVKQDNLQNVVISDQLHGPELGDITMIPGSFAIFEGVADENGSAQQTKNFRNISDEIQLSSDKRSFTYNLGNVEQKTYFLVYYTTYPEGSRLKAENRAKLVYDNGSITKESSFKESIAGGGAVGDNANKIKIKKFDIDDPTKTLAGAKFELYQSDKVTPVENAGKPVVLETGNDGIAQSPTLISGTYYLKEIKAPEGYLLPTEAGNNLEDKGKDNFYKALVTADGIQLFISNKKVEISITGTKTWEDADNQDGKRPAKITVILNKTVNGRTSKVAEKEVTKDNWTYAFNGLPKYENGNEITYSIEEVEVAGYRKEIQGYNLTNRYTPETVDVTGTKTWEDAGNQDGKRPEKITVILNKTVNGRTSKVA